MNKNSILDFKNKESASNRNQFFKVKNRLIRLKCQICKFVSITRIV